MTNEFHLPNLAKSKRSSFCIHRYYVLQATVIRVPKGRQFKDLYCLASMLIYHINRREIPADFLVIYMFQGYMTLKLQQR